MLTKRIIPVLLLRNGALVKTIKFGKFDYIGDPCNTLRIFNELEVDELFLLDIDASRIGKLPNFNLLEEISDECFMPLGYGGGITSLDFAKRVFDSGFEKVALNSSALENPSLITEIANHFGSQSVILSIDVKKSLLGKPSVFSHSGKKRWAISPESWAKRGEELGCGEILLTSIDREGTWSGFDLDLVCKVVEVVDLPVIAHGGAGEMEHISTVLVQSGASAVALGSMVVYQKKDMGVLINFPDKAEMSVALKK